MVFSENPIQPDPESQDNCLVSQWQPWDCEGKCVDGKREGYRRVDRFHIVNGVVVDDVSIYVSNCPTNYTHYFSFFSANAIVGNK